MQIQDLWIGQGIWLIDILNEQIQNRVRVFNATFNNTSVVSHFITLSHNFVSSTPRHEWDSNSQMLVVISTDCIGSCKSNYGIIRSRPQRPLQGRIQDYKLGGGAHLKKLRRAEGGSKIFRVFRVKNHDFTPTNHIFSNCGGRRENLLGYFVWKITILRQKIIFFPILGGGARRVHPPTPGSAPALNTKHLEGDWTCMNHINW
jgi:hypothetical protein